MKCPKCDYIGFETGDRCKNCGYDFSLLAAPEVDPGELQLKPSSEPTTVGEVWLDHPHDPIGVGQAPPELAEQIEVSFPLFLPESAADEAPLIKMPAEPRAPLAVRRTPEMPRSRPAPKPPRPVDAVLTLEFADEASLEALPIVRHAPAAETRTSRASLHDEDATIVAGLGSRISAALIDLTILVGIDIVVIYGTLRMTSLTLSEWQLLPPLPLLAFLGLMKVAYVSAFTAMGGQTIGKMAAGIRVIADDRFRLDPARAIGRTLTGALSLLSLGLGLIPALIGPERRAFHDRVAHTRVVELPSA